MKRSEHSDQRRLVRVVAGGFLIRLMFIFVGTVVDALPVRLKYTDVDYIVVSDAGKLVAQGSE